MVNGASDQPLLARCARQRDEGAFAELVRFFERRTAKEIGDRLGVAEETRDVCLPLRIEQDCHLP